MTPNMSTRAHHVPVIPTGTNAELALYSVFPLIFWSLWPCLSSVLFCICSSLAYLSLLCCPFLQSMSWFASPWQWGGTRAGCCVPSLPDLWSCFSFLADSNWKVPNCSISQPEGRQSWASQPTLRRDSPKSHAASKWPWFNPPGAAMGTIPCSILTLSL